MGIYCIYSKEQQPTVLYRKFNFVTVNKARHGGVYMYDDYNDYNNDNEQRTNEWNDNTSKCAVCGAELREGEICTNCIENEYK